MGGILTICRAVESEASQHGLCELGARRFIVAPSRIASQLSTQAVESAGETNEKESELTLTSPFQFTNRQPMKREHGERAGVAMSELTTRGQVCALKCSNMGE